MLKRWSQLAPLTGIVFVALLVVVTTTTGNTPSDKASGAKVISYYQHHHTAQNVGAYLLTVAAVFGLYFYSSLRRYLQRSAEISNLASTMFGGAVLFAAAMCIGAGTTGALANHPTRLSTSAAQALNYMSNNLFGYMFAAGLIAVMLSAGLAIVRSRLLPAWLGWTALVIGVLPFTYVLLWPAFMATGVWTLIVSVLVYQRAKEPMTIEIPGARVAAPSSREMVEH